MNKIELIRKVRVLVNIKVKGCYDVEQFLLYWSHKVCMLLEWVYQLLIWSFLEWF